MSQVRPGEIEVVRSKRSNYLIQLAGGAIFGALSTVMAIVLSPIINSSRIQGWGIALFDPTSWVWVICFLIFGPLAGLISCITGSFGLLIIDPTGIGPVFKFIATIPMIFVPYFILKLKKEGVKESQILKKPVNYTVAGIISIIIRILAMLIMNFLFLVTVWGLGALPYINLSVIGLGNITGIEALLIFTPLINLYAGALDLAVPYSLVFLPKLDEKVGFW
jgi:riboflavin transporter FmnP